MFDKLVDILVLFWKGLKFVQVVDVWERGVVLRFGKYHRPAEPGVVWYWPFFVERVLTTTVVDEPMTIGPQSLTTADGKRVVVSALFVNTIEDPKKFLLELEGGNAAILLMAHGVLARFVETRTLEQLSPKIDEEGPRPSPSDLPSPSRGLAAAMRRKMGVYGVGVTDAQLIELTDARSIRILGIHA